MKDLSIISLPDRFRSDPTAAANKRLLEIGHGSYPLPLAKARLMSRSAAPRNHI